MPQKKPGRPKAAAKHKRSVRVVILFTQDEATRLQQLADRSGLPFSDFARARLLGGGK